MRMGLDSIWNDEGEYLNLKPRSKGFRARSTGCSCCSIELDTEAEVKREAIDSLMNVLLATQYFKWNFAELIKVARKLDKDRRAESKRERSKKEGKE